VVLNTTVRNEFVVQSEFCIHLFTVTSSIRLVTRIRCGVHNVRGLYTACHGMRMDPLYFYDIKWS